MKREFTGNWVSGGVTTATSDGQPVLIMTSDRAPHDVFVQVGCQRGYQHWLTALRTGLALLEVCSSISDLSSTLSVVVHDTHTERDYSYSGVSFISQSGATFSLHGPNGEVISGPHVGSRFTFHITTSPDTDRAKKLLPKLKLLLEGGEIT